MSVLEKEKKKKKEHHNFESNLICCIGNQSLLITQGWNLEKTNFVTLSVGNCSLQPLFKTNFALLFRTTKMSFEFWKIKIDSEMKVETRKITRLSPKINIDHTNVWLYIDPTNQ